MKERVLLGLLLASLLIFGLDRSTGIFNPIRGVVSVAALPVQYGLYRGGQAVFDTFSFLTFWKSGEQRIKYLELRILELGSQKDRADRLESENLELRRQLGNDKSLLAHRLLPAEVLGVGNDLEIGVGSGEGVTQGMSVVYLNNLVGRVTKATPRASFVQLPQDAAARIPAKSGTVRGLVVGRFGSGIVLTQIAQNEEIAEGNLVSTSGEGETYIADLVIGKVKAVQGEKTALFREATIEPLIDSQRLTTVFVIMD